MPCNGCSRKRAVLRASEEQEDAFMPGTIDSAVTSKNDDDVERDAKREQQQAEQRRSQERKEGPAEQAPGEMPPDQQRERR
jgi:hypothetical protein